MNARDFMQKMGANPDDKPLFTVRVYPAANGDWMVVIEDSFRNETWVIAMQDLTTLGSTLLLRAHYSKSGAVGR